MYNRTYEEWFELEPDAYHVWDISSWKKHNELSVRVFPKREESNVTVEITDGGQSLQGVFTLSNYRAFRMTSCPYLNLLNEKWDFGCYANPQLKFHNNGKKKVKVSVMYVVEEKNDC